MEYRLSRLENPERQDIIFAKGMELETESDYVVNLSLHLLEACSLNEKVPNIISRILLNNLYLQMQEKEIIMTPAH